jgi:predicted RNase H-like nuclease (RuvC/YqgF family)
VFELEKKLSEEKQAREKLEREVEELKRMSNMLSSQVGMQRLSTPKSFKN